MVYFTARSSSSNILYNRGQGGGAVGSIKSILRSTALATGFPGASNTSAYSVKSAFHYDTITESIVWPCTALLKYYMPSTPCREAISESHNIINHVVAPWRIAIQKTLAEHRYKVGRFFPRGYPCNLATELLKAKPTL